MRISAVRSPVVGSTCSIFIVAPGPTASHTLQIHGERAKVRCFQDAAELVPKQMLAAAPETLVPSAASAAQPTAYCTAVLEFLAHAALNSACDKPKWKAIRIALDCAASSSFRQR
jgi:hypothetical protein